MAIKEIKYDKIGSNYNETRKADPFITQRILEQLEPKKGGIYLDIGCGTGNYTKEFQKSGVHFIGIDPSQKMLDKAQSSVNGIDWRLGTVENLDLEQNSIDGVVAMLTIHHWADLNKAFSEISRVLKSQGKLVIFTSTPKQMKGYWLNRYFPKMLEASIKQMPSLEDVERAMNINGFKVLKKEKYNVLPSLQDKFLYSGKHNPELYFEEKVRQGISSFASLSNYEEVQQGLIKLKQDVDTGDIQKIIESYDNQLGDYLFISVKK